MIKRFLASLCALCLLASQALADGFLINSHIYGVPATAFIGCTASTADLTTYTFSSHAIGEAHGNRVVIIGAMGDDNAGGFQVSTVTLDSISATVAVLNTNTLSVQTNGFIAAIADSAGATGTIAVTWDEAITSMVVCVWSSYDIATSPHVGEFRHVRNDGGLLGGNVKEPGTGFVTDAALLVNDRHFAMCGSESNGRTFTWGNLFERADANIGAGGTDGSYSAADDRVITAGAILITCQPTGSGDDNAYVEATFR